MTQKGFANKKIFLHASLTVLLKGHIINNHKKMAPKLKEIIGNCYDCMKQVDSGGDPLCHINICSCCNACSEAIARTLDWDKDAPHHPPFIQIEVANHKAKNCTHRDHTCKD